MKRFISFVLVLCLSLGSVFAYADTGYTNEDLLELTESEKYEIAIKNVDKQFPDATDEYRDFLRGFITDSYQRRIESTELKSSIVTPMSLPSGYFSRYSYTESVKERERTSTYISFSSGFVAGAASKFSYSIALVSGAMCVRYGTSAWELAQFESGSLIYGDQRCYWTDEANYEYVCKTEEKYKYNGQLLKTKNYEWTGDFME